jgi:hypothetical protein
MVPRIETLFAQLVDQRLDDAGAAELVQLLEGDKQASQDFFELLQVHFLLAEQVGPVASFSIEELRAAKAIDDRFDRFVAAASRPEFASTDCSAPWRFLALAASVALAIALWRPWAEEPTLTKRDQRPVVGTEPAAGVKTGDQIVARVRRKIDCDWTDDRWSVAANGEIEAGQLITLTKGLLVLEFASGAEITLNGPATLTATSKSSVKLVRGELSASVPPQARGFRVETHAGNFIDLGTEFGLFVTEDGQVETHVFKGEVVAEVSPPEGKTTATHLNTGEAWAGSSSGAIDVSLDAQPQKFLLPLKDDALPIAAAAEDSPPVTRGLKLRFAADSAVQRDGAGRVSEWGDLLDDRDNQRRENAWQVEASHRPLWIDNSIGGRPALRFDGYSGLITEPLRLGADQTSAIVFRTDGDVAQELISDRTEFRELGVQLLNLNGPPHTVIQVSQDLTIGGRVHLGFIPNHTEPVDVGLVKSPGPINNDAHSLIYSYDADAKVARLFLDGDLISESLNAPQLEATTASRFIGSHFSREGFGFTGDIAEVLVFDGALSSNEAIQLSGWLGQRYRLPSVKSEVSMLPREVHE